MKLIMEKHKDLFAFSTFFYSKLSSQGFKSVLHWHKGKDLSGKRLLLFPVHLKELSHWCLVVANVPNRQLSCLDFLGKQNHTCLKAVKQFLDQASGHSYFIKEEESVPRQSTSYDCGVFVCLYARCLAKGLVLNFSQRDIPTSRNKIVNELLHNTLL